MMCRYNLGLLYAQQEKFREALPEISKVLSARPDFGEGWLMLSDIGDRLSQYDLALFAAEQATRFMPDDARAWSRRGKALSCLECEEEAIEFLRHAVQLDPTAANTWINLCYTAKRIGNLDEAEAAIRQAYKALSCDPR